MTASRPTSSPKLAALAIAIVCLVFFDVVFRHATLQPSNIYPQIERPANWPIIASLPQLNPYTRPEFGFGDLGASAWQSEPARHLMARNFNEHESPYWNPYSASGTVGPETLVDIKFSLWTLISAYFFNASPESFDYGLIILYCLGAFFLLLVLHQQFQLSLLSASVGVLVYLLNGFATANLNSHMGQPYFLFPLLLYSLLRFNRKQTIGHWVFLVFTHAIALLQTFLPTLLLTLVVTHIISLACYFENKPPGHASVKYFSSLLAGVLAAFFLVAFLWFPILLSFQHTDLLSTFLNRPPQHLFKLNNFLSAFTPKHFWQNLSLMLHADLYPRARLGRDENVIAYAGIFTAVMAGYGLSAKTSSRSYTAWACLFFIIFAYLFIFGLIPQWTYHTPILGGIAKQYWGVMSACGLIFMAAFGMENILARQIKSVLPIFVLAILAISFWVLYKKLGLGISFPYRSYIKIIICFFCASAVIVFLLGRYKFNSKPLAITLMVLMVLELLFYMNTVRPLRFSAIRNAPDFVKFIQSNIGESRVLNIGMTHSLFPEYGEMYGIKQVDTQNPAILPWYRHFYTRHFGNDSWEFLTLGPSAEQGKALLADKIIGEHALNIANVKYILVVGTATPYVNFFQQHHYPAVFQKDGLTIFENVNHLPAATLLPALVQSGQIPETPGFNPRLSAVTDDTTLITQAKQLGIPVLPAIDPSLKPLNSSTASVTSFHHTDIIVETSSGQASVLALSEVWHPNWKARVDGHPVYIGRINEAFRGIALPAGQHRIEMVYDSAALRYGIRSSLVTGLVLILLLTYVYLPGLLLSIRRKIS